MKVIIADDERIVRIGLKTMIKWEEHGYELAGTAEDGLAALGLVRSLNPQIVITDLKMPKMDGLQLLHRLKELDFKGKVIVLSNYDEFDLVKEAMKSGAMDYLLKVTLKTEELLDVLKKASKEVDRAFEFQAEHVKLRSAYRQQEEYHKNIWLKDLMLGDLPSTNTKQAYERFGLKCANDFFFCILMVRAGAEAEGGKILNKGLFSFSVRNITSEMLGEWLGTEVVEIDSNSFMAIVPVREGGISAEKRLQAAGSVGKTLELYLNERLNVIVSGCYRSWSELPAVYRMCLEAAKAVFYVEDVGSPKIIQADEDIFSGDWSNSRHYKLLADAQKSLNQMDVLAVEEIFMSVCSDAKKEKIRPEELKAFAGALIDLLLVKGAEEGAGSDKLSVSIHHKFDSSETLSELIRFFNESVELTRSQLSGTNRRWRQEIVKAAEYMKEHAHEKITLSRIAQEVNLNDSYLSRLFKLETGQNIVHYLNELRMERAMELMKDPDLKMKEIAEQVGIEDPFYFNRLFKKHCGVSPSEYKNRLTNFTK